MRRPLWQAWGGRRSVALSWAVTRQAPPAMAAEAAAMCAAHGFRTLKIKGGQGIDTDVRGVREVRMAVGECVALYLDANGAYPREDAARYARAVAGAGVGILTGDVGFMFFTLPSLLPQVEEGKLRALAITSAERSALVPDVPTVAEAGFSDYEVLAWFALFAPRETPELVTQLLASALDRIVARPDIRQKMAKLGAEPHFMNAQATAAFVAGESPRWGALLRDAGGAPQ